MKRFFSPEVRTHYKSIIELGVPIVIGQIGVILVGIFDNIMVGRYALEDLAAAAFVNNVFNMPIFFGLGFAYGLTPLIGQAIGRKDNTTSGSLLKNSLLLNFIIGILLSLAMFILWLNLDKMGQPEELMPLIKDYYLLQLTSIPFVMMFNGFKQFSDGINDTKTPMYIMLVANIINIIGNFILIYGLGSIPALGIVGAGISTLISRIFMLIAIAYIFFNSEKFRVYKDALLSSQYCKKHIIQLGKMGSMVGLQMGMETALFSITVVMIGWLGKIELATHQIMIAISTVGFMVYYGIGAAVAVKVSNYYGVKDFKNMHLAAKTGANIIFFLAFIASILFLIIRNDIALLFTSDPTVAHGVSVLVYTLIAYQFGDALQIAYANVLRGISDVVAMAIISFVGYFIIAIPVSYICGFVFNWGIQGVWIGYPVGLTITGIAMWMRFKSRK